MNYDVDELFEFDGYSLKIYLKKDDPTITELEIPEEYNGIPISIIFFDAFAHSNYLKIVKLPKNLESISDGAFWLCPELERVEFNSSPNIGRNAFNSCPKLPAETVVMGLVGSTDITSPLLAADLWTLEGSIKVIPGDCFRPDVFELLAKNNCFRSIDMSVMLKFLVEMGNAESLHVAEECGLFKSRERVDECIEASVRQGTTELTAYLLDLKNRKFGFKGGDDFEL